MPVRSDTPPYDAELRIATQAAVRAATVCRSIQGKIGAGVLQKADRSPVTVADYCSQALVCESISEAFGDDPIVAEEDSDDLRAPEHEPMRQRIVAELRDSPIATAGTSAARVLELIGLGNAAVDPTRCWTVDPIDGTKGFLRGQQYAIAVALIVEGRVVVGVLACPQLSWGDRKGTVLTAVRGHGAFAAPLSHPAARTAIGVSPTDDPTQARACESVESGHSDHGASAEIGRRLGIAVPPVRLDSQAKYGVVARGDAELYLRLPTRPDYEEKIWDHAAGSLIVEQAGGRVTDIHGTALDFSRGRRLAAGAGVLASNGRLHDPLVRAVGEALTPRRD